MKFFKNKQVLPLVLLLGLIYGCGGGGSTGGGVPGAGAGGCTAYTPLAGNQFKISVKENGIYVITPDILKSFCVDSTGTPLTGFKLQNFDPTPGIKKLIDIPVSFDPQGNLEFYGVGVNRNDYTAPNADYTETNIYWLTPATTTSLQLTMGTKTSVSATTTIPAMTIFHQEMNSLYWSGMIMSVGNGWDHWFWDRLVPDPGTIYKFSLNNYDSRFPGVPLKLSIALQSQIATNHSVSAILQTPSFSPTISWSTTDPYVYTGILSGSLTNEALNALQLANKISGDQVYFDWIELEYPGQAYNDQIMFHGNIPSTGSYVFNVNGFTQNNIELFDISNSRTPVKFDPPIPGTPVGAGYQLSFGDNLTVGTNNNYIALTTAQRKQPVAIVPVASRDLKTIFTTPFDYLIITHRDFTSNLQPLISYRGSTPGGSHAVQMVTVEEVYDNFSGGIFTPQAIKDFLTNVFPSMAQPAYVLLVGDASFDYKNYLGYGQENFVPTYLMEYSFGQTPSDYWFIQDSNGNLHLPLMAIGRIPAKTSTEVSIVVNKIINYETRYKPNLSWNKNAIFVAAGDNGATFESDSNTLMNTLPASINNRIPIYYSVLTSSTYSSIISNINLGALITNYLGHGSVEMWANGTNGFLGNIFFQSSDVPNLSNINKLT
ncbi:MAG: C25 family cysteine peptidase, partial [Nitrospiria bacterium]